MDECGTQQPIALLKSIFDKQGMYNRQKCFDWKDLVNICNELKFISKEFFFFSFFFLYPYGFFRLFRCDEPRGRQQKRTGPAVFVVVFGVFVAEPDGWYDSKRFQFNPIGSHDFLSGRHQIFGTENHRHDGSPIQSTLYKVFKSDFLSLFYSKLREKRASSVHDSKITIFKIIMKSKMPIYFYCARTAILIILQINTHDSYLVVLPSSHNR